MFTSFFFNRIYVLNSKSIDTQTHAYTDWHAHEFIHEIQFCEEQKFHWQQFSSNDRNLYMSVNLFCQ